MLICSRPFAPFHRSVCPHPPNTPHSGDTRGRRLTLLLSIVFMAVPTVLIGCLPAYEHIGVAAPVLLALLRLVQGVAMGGEFGSALVSGVCAHM